ncbi:MAG: SGNH/GDSL hydrolase family protein [Ruminococcaceae bacterium]|nr:SGNH/GDSL hydrolase family protein [Oscillospiraceae bacterium]
MKRILIFGDSIMRGVYYSEEAGRHKLFGERLRGLKELGYEVKNCSVMGATIGTGRELIEKRLTIPAENTTVIFEYGGNDCDFRWGDISANPSGEFSPNTPHEKFVSTYGECIKYARDLGAKVLICNLVPLDADKYMNWISRGLNHDNIISWLGDTSMLYRWHEYYNRTAESIAQKLSCPLIDIRSPFLLSHNYANLLSPDGIHPTVEGHQVIDHLIAEAVA